MNWKVSSLRVRHQTGDVICQWPRGWCSTFDAVTCNSRGKWWLGAIVWIWGVIESCRNLSVMTIIVVGPSWSIRTGITVPSSHRSFRLSPSIRGVIPLPLPVEANREVAGRGIRLGGGLPSRSRPRLREFRLEPRSRCGRVVRLAYGIA